MGTWCYNSYTWSYSLVCCIVKHQSGAGLDFFFSALRIRRGLFEPLSRRGVSPKCQKIPEHCPKWRNRHSPKFSAKWMRCITSIFQDFPGILLPQNSQDFEVKTSQKHIRPFVTHHVSNGKRAPRCLGLFWWMKYFPVMWGNMS